MAAVTRAVSRAASPTGASHTNFLAKNGFPSRSHDANDSHQGTSTSRSLATEVSLSTNLLLSPRTPDPRPSHVQQVGHAVVGNITDVTTPPPEVLNASTPVVTVSTRSRRHKRAVDLSSDALRSTSRGSHISPTTVLKLQSLDDIALRRRGAAGISAVEPPGISSANRRRQLSPERLAETLNAVSLFSVVRRLEEQNRKSSSSAQRGRLLPAYHGSMFSKSCSVTFPPGALPENLIVWVRCTKDMPSQPRSVVEAYPWHLGKILYTKPCPGYALSFVHSKGLPEDVNSYLMAWATAGHSQCSAAPYQQQHGSLCPSALQCSAPKRVSLNSGCTPYHRSAYDASVRFGFGIQ